jgi:hypothetical protein
VAAPSVFVPLDVNYLRDPRIRRAGPDAELLYVRSLAYAKGGDTDGVVYDYDLDVIAVGLTRVKARVDALVREGAWEVCDGGWFITAWFKWNPPVEALRDKRRRQAEGAAKTNHTRHTAKGNPFVRDCPVCLGDVPPAQPERSTER